MNNTPAPTASSTDTPSPLQSEVTACLPAISVLRRQLLDSVTHVEDSVVAVCANFQQMAKRSREVVANMVSLTQDNAQSGSQSGIDSLIVDTRTTLTRVLSRLESLSDFSQDAAQQINQVAASTRDIERSISEIDDIAANARVVALNGSIEAARMGQAGAAFAVVAKETSHLASLARSVSDSARTLLERVVRLVSQTSVSLQERASQESREVAVCRDQVQTNLGDLSHAGQSLQHAVWDAKSANESLAADLGKAIAAMQFQDATKQRIQHVVEILAEMQEALEAKLSLATEGASDPIDWTERLSSRYVMAEERRAHAGEASQVVLSESSELGDNIELF
ncbi:MAG TPA: methyl-accepting chemotaxis protein [Pirellulaceae bacterium]|nr:methyl-accepting chemotaxis protein [Pirellulaceae bacterium]